jgi:hypothetical protein
MGQARKNRHRQDYQDRTARTEGCQYRTARIGLPGQSRQHRTARKRQPGQGRKERGARKG